MLTDQAIQFLLEFAKDVRAKFLKQGASEEEVDSYLSRFQELRDKRILKGEQRDIGQYKTFGDLKQVVDKASKVVTKRQKKKKAKAKGAQVVHSDNNVTVYHITSKPAACFYGAGTKWCISATHGRNMFKPYQEQGISFYFIISKNRSAEDPLHKVAVAVYPGEEAIEVYNAKDNLVSVSVLKELGVSELDIFKKYTTVDLTTKEGFLEWLGKQNVGEMDVDGKVNIHGDLDLSHKGLIKFPVEFGKVTGSFYCGNNQLTSLQGAPTEVGDYFDCSYNQLTSLQGAPAEVGGSFSCGHNQLTSLQGAPTEVGGYFSCAYNQLTSLQGAPTEVGGYFSCAYNRLTSLQGVPTEVGGYFSCAYNRLTSLQGVPAKVGGKFYCAHNPGNFTQQDIAKAMGGVEEAIIYLLDHS